MIRRTLWRRRTIPAAVAVALSAGLLLAVSCDDDPAGILDPSDSVPPSPVCDLRASDFGPDRVTFTWTAPGDDSLAGRAARYEFRHSSDYGAIRGWTAGTVLALPRPSPAGATETATLGGLTPGQIDYAALRTFDDGENGSPRSNIVVAMAPPRSEDHLLELFEAAWRAMDPAAFERVLARPEETEYAFFFAADFDPGSTSLSRAQDVRCIQRMFGSCSAGDPAVPPELWLVVIEPELTRISSSWTERPELYRSDTNPAGVDATRWRATDAVYQTDVFFETQGETDYLVIGRANFVVLEDRTRTADEERKYVLYRWEDLGARTGTLSEPSTWGGVKTLYLP